MGRNQPPEGSLQFSGVRALADVQGQPDAFAVGVDLSTPRARFDWIERVKARLALRDAISEHLTTCADFLSGDASVTLAELTSALPASASAPLTEEAVSASLQDGINEGLKLETIEKDGKIVSISIRGSGAALLAELRLFSAAAGEAVPGKEMYYNADGDGWDMHGLVSDIEVAKGEARERAANAD